MNLITLNDITAITNLTDTDLENLIPYAQAEAAARLGYLEAESIEEVQYVYDAGCQFQTERYPITAMSSVKYQGTASADVETVDTDEYRTITRDGLVILDFEVPEHYTVTLTYTIGWTAATATPLVKLFLVALVLHEYFSLHPEKAVAFSAIVMEKIGDHTIRYGGVDVQTTMTLLDWCDYLASAVAKGGFGPQVG